MGRGFLQNSRFSTLAFSILVTVTLLFSFGFHSVQIAHSHPGHTEHHGNTQQEGQEHGGGSLSLGEYMHAADKKLFIILASLSLLAFSFLATFGSWEQFMVSILHRYSTVFRHFKNIPTRLYSFLSQCLRIGILHPKLH